VISQTVEYALRAMSHLASLQGAAATSEAIARATRVPRGYLSKIMRDLVCAGLVQSFRGLHGGFRLARDPSGISVLDIVNAVDPVRHVERCPLDNPLHERLCPLHRCLNEAMRAMEQAFRRTTLTTVLEGEREPGTCRSLLAPGPSPPAKPIV
jgi:Rrf2 family nitric oxide-sensitive transcriptional repressor